MNKIDKIDKITRKITPKKQGGTIDHSNAKKESTEKYKK